MPKHRLFSLCILLAALLTVSLAAAAEEGAAGEAPAAVETAGETVPFFGQEVSPDAEILTLDGYELTDEEFAALPEMLKSFPNLKKLELLHTGRTNEELDALNRSLADVRVVWTVKLGKIWELRTDETAFSTKHSSQKRHEKTDLKTADIQVLQYCTDLEALDLGHHNIDDISVLANLKKLKILIVIDNRVSDLSPLAELTDLEYAELFLLRVTDLSPLANLKNLKHLNLAHNRLSKSDLSPLYGLTNLERLWVNSCGLSKQQQQDLQAALPNTKMEFKEYESTGAGWRTGEVYENLREIFQYG